MTESEGQALQQRKIRDVMFSSRSLPEFDPLFTDFLGSFKSSGGSGSLIHSV